MQQYSIIRQEQADSKENKMVRSLGSLLDSLLKYSMGSPIHLILITDQQSKDKVMYSK
jgi:hypothetical protein